MNLLDIQHHFSPSRTRHLRRTGTQSDWTGAYLIIDYAKSIDILKALHMLKRPWLLVSSATIENYFRKADFLGSDDTSDVDKMQKVLDVSEFGEVIQKEDFEAFVNCDKEAECFGDLTDAEKYAIQ